MIVLTRKYDVLRAYIVHEQRSIREEEVAAVRGRASCILPSCL
jgi:hypothetical protein